jgi:AraC family transcriptional regulator
MSVPSFLDWYSRGRLAPYVRSFHNMGTDMVLIEANQPAGDMSDPQTADFAFGLMMSPLDKGYVDLGAGAFRRLPTMGQMFVGAPTGNTVILDRPHPLRFLTLPATRVLAFADEYDIPARDFGGLHTSAFEDSLSRELLTTLWSDAEAGTPNGLMFAETATRTLLARLFALSSAKPRTEVRGGLAAWQLTRVEEFAQQNLAGEIGLADLSGTLGLSTAHFCRAFKVSTGQTPFRWFMGLRLRRAAELLVETNLSTLDIALAAGFKTAAHFAVAFSKRVGCAPTEYRRNHRPPRSARR